MQRFEGDADIETWLMADCEGMIWESWSMQYHKLSQAMMTIHQRLDQSLSSRNLVIVNEKMMP